MTSKEDKRRANAQASVALPGPHLTDEQLLAELKHGLESGVAPGNVVKRLLAELREGEREAKTA